MVGRIEGSHMTTGERITAPSAASLLPGGVIIARIRQLVSAAIAAGVLYSVFTSAGKSGCLGGVTGSGGFLDANGTPTDVVPDCVNLALRPSPLLLLLLAVIVLMALGRVLRRAESEASALRVLDRATVIVIALAAASVLIAQVWFALIPLSGIGGEGTYIWPFPFGSVDFQRSPMVAA